MVKFLIKLGYYQSVFCFILLGIYFSVQSIDAAEDGTVDTTRFTFASAQTEKDKTQFPDATSSQTFSFDDVYQLKLDLDIFGDVRIVATDSNVEDKDTINVTLEKRILEHNPILTKIFLDNILITGTKTDGILQLNAKLPEDISKAILEKENTFEIKKHLHLDYTINTPPDVSVQLKMKTGDVYLHHIRGNIEITNELGNVHLDETLGNYKIEVKQGRIHGKILLTPGENQIKTLNGSIELTVLDDLAAQLDLTALGGDIGLLLPKNYPADVELKNDKQHYIINLPAEMDNNIGIINGGGPLLKLTATDTISVLPNPRLHSSSEDAKPTAPEEITSTELTQLIPLTEKPPVIDGNLSEKVWLNATTLSPFQNPTGTQTAVNTTDVYLMWDAVYLYVGARVHLSNYHLPRVSQTQKDSPIWEDESVEILLDMHPDTEDYSHLVVNPIGAFFDQRVTKEGFPNYRFAPKDFPRIPIDDSIEKFKSDISWNSDAKVATKINTNFWSFEVAFPLGSAGRKDKDTWLLNVHRKAQGKVGNAEDIEPSLYREYSYWLPIYDEEYPWWPHWKEGMGKVKLDKAQQSVSKTFEVSERLEVTKIEIEGNTAIPTKVLLDHIPIASGDTITNEQLAWLIAELENSDWFQEVKLKTVVLDTDKAESPPVNPSTTTLANSESNDTVSEEIENLPNTEPLKITLQISVTEAPVKFANQIKIIENKSFPSLFIKNWFDLSVGYLADDNLNLKQQMITDFYVNRGYPFAKVTHEFVNDTLLLNVNEGYLDEIRFTGNSRISQDELILAFDIDTKKVYYHALGQTKINKLREKLKKTNEDFKSIQDWHVQREGGRNIMIVEIQEQPFVKPGWYPILGFNRVHGLVLGAGGTLSTQFTGEEQLFGSVSGGFASKIWNYNFGVEKNFFKRYPLALGAGLFKFTDISSNNYRLLPVEVDLSAAVYGTAFQDYYQRQGEHIWLAQTFGKLGLMRLEFTQEDHDNLSKSTDWSYFDRKRLKRGNSRIDRGLLKMLSLTYTFDTRDYKSTIEGPQYVGSHLLLWPNERTRRGWRGHFGMEMAGGSFGGDFTFNFLKFELVRYTPLFGPHHLNIRLSGDYSNVPLPRQRLLYLGGATTLRGYDFNAFAGDRRVLLNIEYRLFQETHINTNTDAVIGWALSSFFDTGRVWWYGENPFSEFSLSELKTSIGVGVSFFISPPIGLQPFSTAVEIAVPLNVDYSLRTPRIIWRLERMF